MTSSVGCKKTQPNYGTIVKKNKLESARNVFSCHISQQLPNGSQLT